MINLSDVLLMPWRTRNWWHRRGPPHASPTGIVRRMFPRIVLHLFSVQTIYVCSSKLAYMNAALCVLVLKCDEVGHIRGAAQRRALQSIYKTFTGSFSIHNLHIPYTYDTTHWYSSINRTKSGISLRLKHDWLQCALWRLGPWMDGEFYTDWIYNTFSIIFLNNMQCSFYNFGTTIERQDGNGGHETFT